MDEITQIWFALSVSAAVIFILCLVVRHLDKRITRLEKMHEDVSH
jgi:hypothetical protein